MRLELPHCAEPPLKSWPEAERPRERLSAMGARDLSEAELLAVLLRTGGGGRGAMGLARCVQQLAQQRGGLSCLQLADLRSLAGVGPAKAASLLAAIELGRREAAAGMPAPLAGPAGAVEALRPLLAGRREEHVAVLALDARRRVLAAELLSKGTLTQSLVHPREVFRAAVKLGAVGVVLGHNHPSGDPSPSPEDHALTRRLREAADIMGIPLLDHVIVGSHACFSYADSQWRCC